MIWFSGAAGSSSTTYVVREDTYLLVLVCFHVKCSDRAVFFYSGKQTDNQQRVWHMQKLKQSLKPQTVNVLPSLHAINGCDTFRLYGIGKGVRSPEEDGQCQLYMPTG